MASGELAAMVGAQRKTRADHVHDSLLIRFMDGSWSPGQSINIPDVAREYEVSQTPVREALARLEHTGLVRREALKGYRVAPLFAPDDIEKLMEARLVLEPALARGAAAHVSPEFLAQLAKTSASLHALADLPRKGIASTYWRADEAFHALIARQSGNTYLTSAYESLGGQVQRFRIVAQLESLDPRRTATEHDQVVSALAATDGALAASRITDHIRSSRARALSDRRRLDVDMR